MRELVFFSRCPEQMREKYIYITKNNTLNKENKINTGINYYTIFLILKECKNLKILSISLPKIKY